MTAISSVMENVHAYRLWQAPFVKQKLAPIHRHNDLGAARRVLDVGCGPGTNTSQFLHTSYLGLDLNPRYLAWARRRYGKDFVATDVRTYTAGPQARFDFILLNSFLHHVDTASADRILAHLATLLRDDGHIHILDLVLPDDASLARRLAEWDRGEHPRPFDVWARLFGEHFEPVVTEPYAVGWAGVPLWHMIYFKGRRR